MMKLGRLRAPPYVVNVSMRIDYDMRRRTVATYNPITVKIKDESRRRHIIKDSIVYRRERFALKICPTADGVGMSVIEFVSEQGANFCIGNAHQQRVLTPFFTL